MVVTVITISDRAFHGVYQDLAGPEIEAILRKYHSDWKIVREIVPDDADRIVEMFIRHAGSDYIITTGGTGVGPRDITPEVTEEYCDRALPGIAEYLRHESIKETPHAVFSRGYSGMKGSTIIVNYPGSVKAVRLCTRLLLPVMEHGEEMVRGGGH